MTSGYDAAPQAQYPRKSRHMSRGKVSAEIGGSVAGDSLERYSKRVKQRGGMSALLYKFLRAKFPSQSRGRVSAEIGGSVAGDSLERYSKRVKQRGGMSALLYKFLRAKFPSESRG